jgi:hypothetical protein
VPLMSGWLEELLYASFGTYTRNCNPVLKLFLAACGTGVVSQRKGIQRLLRFNLWCVKSGGIWILPTLKIGVLHSLTRSRNPVQS